MTTPNVALRAARMRMGLSQDDLAREVRKAGARLGVPNDVSKRTVQRWECGTTPRPAYALALEAVTGLPVASLGFTADSRSPDHDPIALLRAAGTWSGVWVSRYEYESSSRRAVFASAHHVVVLQHGDRLTVRSLPGSAKSTLTMDLVVDGSVITGTWRESTDPGGYYRGAVYHGAIQLLGDPAGRRLSGKWVGFGADSEVNTGPWSLTLLDSSTSKATVSAYDRPADV